MKAHKIVVVMPSYLGEYKGCAKHRDEKFLRAVNSVITQDYDNKELVVVSDGCQLTVDLCEKISESGYGWIHLIKIDKQDYMSGEVRNAGIRYAVDNLGADIITYLDTDDQMLKGHLSNINREFCLHERAEWIWYDDLLKIGYQRRGVELKMSRIGTSNISHRAGVLVNWGGGYGHDWGVILEMIERYRGVKVGFASYVVCHIPGRFDL